MEVVCSVCCVYTVGYGVYAEYTRLWDSKGRPLQKKNDELCEKWPCKSQPPLTVHHLCISFQNARAMSIYSSFKRTGKHKKIITGKSFSIVKLRTRNYFVSYPLMKNLKKLLAGPILSHRGKLYHSKPILISLRRPCHKFWRITKITFTIHELV
jgi:hypothetical protein